MCPTLGLQIHQILKAVTAADHPNSSQNSEWRRVFVDDMGGLVLAYGAPRALMRVLGWMVVCESPDQTAADVQKELELSAGSVSTSLRFLGELGLVERVSRPGDRRIFYRLNTDGWEIVLQRAIPRLQRDPRRGRQGRRGRRRTGQRPPPRDADTWAFLEARRGRVAGEQSGPPRSCGGTPGRDGTAPERLTDSTPLPVRRWAEQDDGGVAAGRAQRVASKAAQPARAKSTTAVTMRTVAMLISRSRL